MDTKQLTKLITQRKALRDSLSKQAKALDEHIVDQNIEEIELSYDLICARAESVTALDAEISGLLEGDSFAKDQVEILEFQEIIVRMRKKAEKHLPVQKVEPPPEPEPIKTEPKGARLPEIKIQTFDGKHEEYHTFWETFQSTIGSRDDVTDIAKLTYLMSYLKGEAARAVRGLSMTAANYKHASDILKERYGSQEILINTIMSKLIKVKPITDGWQLNSLRSMCDDIDVGVRQLDSAGIKMESYGPVLLPILMSKLPSNVLLMWNRRRHDSENTLKEFLSYLKQELSNSPVNSRRTSRALVRNHFQIKKQTIKRLKIIRISCH